MELACDPKAYDRSKARPKRTISRSGKADFVLERVEVGPART